MRAVIVEVLKIPDVCSRCVKTIEAGSHGVTFDDLSYCILCAREVRDGLIGALKTHAESRLTAVSRLTFKKETP